MMNPKTTKTFAPAARPERVWRAVTAVSGGALLTLGAMTALAWSMGEQDYLQLSSSRPPLHYNGAVAFLVWGAAYGALAKGWNRTARVLAVALGLLGVLIVLASVPGIGFRIDQWAMAAPHRTLPPGGTPAQFGLGCGLAAVAIIIVTARASLAATGLVALIGILCAVGGPVMLATAQSNVSTSAFGAPTSLGATGVAVAGLALVAFAFRSGTPVFALGHAIPLLVGVAGIGLTFVLWAALNADQGRRIQRQVQFETAQVQRLIQDRLAHELDRFKELAEKLPPNQPVPVPPGFRVDVGSYVGQTPGCLGVCRIDAAGTVTWAEAQPGLPATLAEFGAADTLLAASGKAQKLVVRPPRSNWRGTRVLLMFTPCRPDAGGGGLVSVLRLQNLFDTFVNANVAPGYAVAVTQDGDEVFSRFTTEGDFQEQWGQSLPFRFEETDWRLSVWPTQDVLVRESLSLPKLSLMIGLLMTGLLALAVHLAQTARRRTSALEREVRERQQAEDAMRLSEEKYRTLIENLGQGIFLQDRAHRFVAANAQFCRGLKRSETEIVGATEAELFDPHVAEGHAAEVHTVLTEGRSVESEQEETVAGQRRCVRRVLTPVRDASGQTTGVLGICWDVSEQRRLEEHVHQASKMDAIGQLAGGIAHDFNNLLTVILGNLELIHVRNGAGPADELLASATRAAARAAALTQRLLGFSRRHQLDWRPTDINAVAGEVVALLQPTIDPLIRLDVHLTEEPWPVQGDPTQLNQVLMNLCINARDAMPGAGQITIETACVTIPEPRDVLGVGRSGDFVRLSVIDTGAGMSPEVKARIYEPFFTTKDVGKGTGLGLAMVFAIVRQHKGWIDCWSEEGVGTSFDIYLPRGEVAKPVAPAATRPAARAARHGTVLVVDDEDMIRTLAAMTLEGQGYRVIQAADGQQALEVYAAEMRNIDLVVLDLTMPVLSGHEAFRQLLNLNPKVRVVFASGYAVEQLNDLEKQLMAGFVKKPYRPNELLLAVDEAFQGPGTAETVSVAVQATPLVIPRDPPRVPPTPPEPFCAPLGDSRH